MYSSELMQLLASVQMTLLQLRWCVYRSHKEYINIKTKNTSSNICCHQQPEEKDPGTQAVYIKLHVKHSGEVWYLPGPFLISLISPPRLLQSPIYFRQQRCCDARPDLSQPMTALHASPGYYFINCFHRNAMFTVRTAVRSVQKAEQCVKYISLSITGLLSLFAVV